MKSRPPRRRSGAEPDRERRRCHRVDDARASCWRAGARGHGRRRSTDAEHLRPDRRRRSRSAPSALRGLGAEVVRVALRLGRVLPVAAARRRSTRVRRAWRPLGRRARTRTSSTRPPSQAPSTRRGADVALVYHFEMLAASRGARRFRASRPWATRPQLSALYRFREELRPGRLPSGGSFASRPSVRLPAAAARPLPERVRRVGRLRRAPRRLAARARRARLPLPAHAGTRSGRARRATGAAARRRRASCSSAT